MSATAAGQRAVEFAPHAIERYSQRVRPGLDLDRVTAELDGVVAMAEFVERPPRWMPWDERSPLYLQLGDVVFPLRPTGTGGSWVAVTCLTRGSFSPERRVRRNQRRKARRRSDGGGRVGHGRRRRFGDEPLAA